MPKRELRATVYDGKPRQVQIGTYRRQGRRRWRTWSYEQVPYDDELFQAACWYLHHVADFNEILAAGAKIDLSRIARPNHMRISDES
jgi:hypothetical protein